MSTVQSGIATSFINFSRASNATVVDSDGLIKWAAHNLLLNSESFNSSNWTKYESTVSANVIAAPNGTLTADKLVDTVTNDYHGMRQSGPTLAGDFIWSAYLKAAEYSKAYIYDSNGGEYGLFDLTNGEVLDSNTDDAGTEFVGNGWYRCWIKDDRSGGSSVRLNIELVNDAGSDVFAGTGSSGIYVWGAHLRRADLGGMQSNYSAYPFYNSTTPKNLLGFTETLTTGWTNTNTIETAVTEPNPNGLSNSVELTATAANGTFLSSLTLAAVPYTFSVWLKRKTGTGNIQLTVDGTTYSTVAVTNTWTRFSTTLTPSAGTKTPGIRIAIAGDAVYVWGAQLSDSASLDTYSPNHFAAPTVAAYYGPRRDFDPATRACKGLLVEGQRTNFLINSFTLSTQSVGVTAAAHTLSFYGTGTITLSGASTAGPLVGTGANNRVSLTFTPTAATLTLTVSGTVTNAQLELGSFATSYIPTKSTSSVRTTDLAYVTTSVFPYSVEGTLVANFTPINLATSRNAVQLDDGTWNKRITIGTNSSANGSFVVVDGGTSQASITTGTATVNSPIKLATRFGINDFAVSSNGAVVATDTSGTPPITNTLRITTNEPPALTTWNSTTDVYVQSVPTEEILSGWIRQITYIPRKLSNSELQGKSL